MKKPDIGKRILPLLDIIFILLAFFIVLPHGIKSNEFLENDALKQTNHDINRELEYYRWKYGPAQNFTTRTDKLVQLTVRNNKVYFEEGGEIPLAELKKKLENRQVTFVIIKIDVDLSDQEQTKEKTLTQIENILGELHITSIRYYAK